MRWFSLTLTWVLATSALALPTDDSQHNEIQVRTISKGTYDTAEYTKLKTKAAPTKDFSQKDYFKALTAVKDCFGLRGTKWVVAGGLALQLQKEARGTGRNIEIATAADKDAITSMARQNKNFILPADTVVGGASDSESTVRAYFKIGSSFFGLSTPSVIQVDFVKPGTQGTPKKINMERDTTMVAFKTGDTKAGAFQILKKSVIQKAAGQKTTSS